MTVRVLSSSIIAVLMLWVSISYALAPDRVPLAPSVSVFEPGVISGPAHDSAPAFTSDGNTVYFGRSNSAQSTIYVSHRHGNHWSKPEVASFSGTWNDMEPAFAPDGSWLVFVSNRPARVWEPPIEAKYNGSPQKGGNL